MLLIKFKYESLEGNHHVKLLNINIKNESIFNLLKLLCNLQSTFLSSNCLQDLCIFKRANIIELYKKTYNLYFDSSILSKILNNSSVLLNGRKRFLAELVPKEIFLYSLYIKDIITKNPANLNDTNVAMLLYQQYNILLSRRKVCYIRNKYLIQPISKRHDSYFYINNDKLFSPYQELKKENILNLAKNTKGIYELSSLKKENYPTTKSTIIYLGSSKDLKQRLLMYTSNNAHTESLKNYINTNSIYFRTINTVNYKEYEMIFLNAFIVLYGNLPLLNKQIIREKT